MTRDAAPSPCLDRATFATVMRLVAGLLIVLCAEVLPRWRHHPEACRAVARATSAVAVAAWRLRRSGGARDALVALGRATTALREALEVLVALEDVARRRPRPAAVLSRVVPVASRPVVRSVRPRSRDGPPSILAA